MSSEEADRNEQLLLRAYDALARKDMDGYLACLFDDVVVHIPGRSRIAGEYRGKDEVRRHYREIAEYSGGTFRTTVHDVLSSDAHVVGLIEARAERDGRVVEFPRVHVWHVRDGLLATLWVQPADQYLFDDYWGQESRA